MSIQLNTVSCPVGRHWKSPHQCFLAAVLTDWECNRSCFGWLPPPHFSSKHSQHRNDFAMYTLACDSPWNTSKRFQFSLYHLSPTKVKLLWWSVQAFPAVLILQARTAPPFSRQWNSKTIAVICNIEGCSNFSSSSHLRKQMNPDPGKIYRKGWAGRNTFPTSNCLGIIGNATCMLLASHFLWHTASLCIIAQHKSVT